MDSVSIGCDRLDALLGGGLPENRSLLVTGPPGSSRLVAYESDPPYVDFV